MKLEELKKAVSDELSSRNLKNPKIRGNALIKVCDFIKKQSNKYIMTNGDLIFPSDKDILKKETARVPFLFCCARSAKPDERHQSRKSWRVHSTSPRQRDR